MTATAPPKPAWALAYRPLAGRTLLVQTAVLIVAELALFASYRGHEAGFHWATHFLVGLTAAGLLNLAWLALKGAPMRGQIASIYGLHLFAMFPDLLFSAGIPHDDWMDVFLGHISSHYVAGGAATWLVLALASSGIYAGALSLWLRARRIEAEAGQAPGIGIGGAALLRPQASPSREGLAHTRFGPARAPDVVLLHGLGASRAVWAPVAAELESRAVAGVVPDLLGFGASRSIGTSFGLDEHVDALLRLLGQDAAEPVVVVGHSFGGAVAAALAAADPRRVRALVLVSPPVFRDAARARERLGQRGWLSRQVLRGSPLASVACGLMCILRRPAARLAALTARGVPRQVALDGVQHTWPAYRDALTTLLEENPLPGAILHPVRPTTLILGEADAEAPAADVLDWPHGSVYVILLPGDHLLPLSSPAVIADRIAAQLARESLRGRRYDDAS